MASSSEIVDCFFEDDVVYKSNCSGKFENDFTGEPGSEKDRYIKNYEDESGILDNKNDCSSAPSKNLACDAGDDYQFHSNDTDLKHDLSEQNDVGDDFNWSGFSFSETGKSKTYPDKTVGTTVTNRVADEDDYDQTKDTTVKETSITPHDKRQERNKDSLTENKEIPDSRNMSPKNKETNDEFSLPLAEEEIKNEGALKHRLYTNENGWCLTEDDLNSFNWWGSTAKPDPACFKSNAPHISRELPSGSKKGRRRTTRYHRGLTPVSLLFSLAKSRGGFLENTLQVVDHSTGKPVYLPCLQCHEDGRSAMTRYSYEERQTESQSSERCSTCGGKRVQMTNVLKGIREFYKRVGEKGFEVHDVSPDGNCQFEAVVDQLKMQGHFFYQGHELRMAAVQYLLDNPVLEDGTCYKDFMATESWPEYLDRMSEDGEWGDHIMLTAMAYVLQRRIIVYADREGLTIHEITPANIHNTGDPSASNVDIHVGHLGESHYVSLRPKDWLIPSSRSKTNQDCKKTNGVTFPIERFDFLLNQLIASESIKPCTDEEDISVTSHHVGPCVMGMHPLPYNSSDTESTVIDMRFSGGEEDFNSNLYMLHLSKDSKVALDGQCQNNRDVIPEGSMSDSFRLTRANTSPTKKVNKNSRDSNRVKWPDAANRKTERGLWSVKGFPCEWPNVAMEWVTRPRNKDFLDSQQTDSIVKHGCQVVPAYHGKGFARLMTDYIDSDMAQDKDVWIASFVFAEKFLCSCLSMERRATYLMLNTWLRPKFDELKLPRYFLRVIFYYACESIDAVAWVNAPAQCLLTMVKILKESFQKHFLADYFISEKNLLRNVPSKTVTDMSEYLRLQLENPMTNIYNVLDRLRITSSDLGSFVDLVFREMLLGSEDSILVTKEHFRAATGELVAKFFESHNYTSALNVTKALQSHLQIQYAQTDTIEITAFAITNMMAMPFRWNFALLVDITFETSMTKALCEGFEQLPITEVFGPDSANQLADTCLPNKASIDKGDLLYPLSLVYLLSALGNAVAKVSCLKFYLKKYAQICKGLDLPIIPVEDKTSLTKLVDLYIHLVSYSGSWKATPGVNDEWTIQKALLCALHDIYVSLFNSLLSLKRTDEFVDFFPQLQSVCEATQVPYHARNLRAIQSHLEGGGESRGSFTFVLVSK